jgi:hypothetical protein
MVHTPRYTHLRVPYYRPRFMGGDTQHPLCRKPDIGWAGPRYACWPMIDVKSKVDCPWCLACLSGPRLANDVGVAA